MKKPKTHISAIIVLLLVSSQSFGQIQGPKEIQATMSQGKANAWQVFIPNSTDKQALAAWRKFSKEYNAKTEKVKKSDDYLSTDALIPSLSAEPLTLYTQFKESPEGAYITTFVKLNGAFLNSHQHSKQSIEWVRLLAAMANDLGRRRVENLIGKEEKDLKEKNKALDKLVRDRQTYEQDIVNAEKTIEDRRKKLEKNVKDQELQKTQIKDQEVKVQAVRKELTKYPN